MEEKLGVFQAIKERRVTRMFTQEPVAQDQLLHLLKAARWAPSGGDRRIHKFTVVEGKDTIELIRALSPGMYGHPTALIVICTDKTKARLGGVKLSLDTTTWIDVGAAAQNMMLAAHELGLGSCPTTSFSHSGVRAVLNLPDQLEPEYVLQLGYPDPQVRFLKASAPKRLRVEDIALWGKLPES